MMRCSLFGRIPALALLILPLLFPGRQSIAQQYDLKAGLLSVYEFEEDARDGSGEHHGTVNGARLEPGRCGRGSYYFDGRDSYIDFGNDRSLNGNFSGLTVAVWMRVMETSETQLSTVLAKWAFDPMQDHFGLWLNSSYKVVFAVSGPSVMEEGTFSKNSLVPKEWHHVVGTWRANGEIRIYIDGQLDRTGRQTGRGINQWSNVSLKAGRQMVRRDRPFKGYIDNLRLYRRALSDAEVNALYLLGRSECERIIVRGRVLNRDTGEPVPSEVLFENLADGSPFTQHDATDGRYEVVLPLNGKFGFYAKADNFIAENQNIDTHNRNENDVVECDLYLIPMEVGRTVRLNNIFFDFDKATLRPESHAELNRILPFFEQYPGLRVELSGHTDSRGTDEYNEHLSDARAKSVRSYLINNGLHPSRAEAIGYGEQQPVADNESDEGRQLNRRVEFKILEINGPQVGSIW
jgi:outer membrane protein OmpA-like peptidoglycan-associated protein